MLESGFKAKFLEELENRLPQLDLDFYTTDRRSMPDTAVLGPGVWAVLEFKKMEDADQQPNQGHHIRRLNKKGYAAFVYPENAEEVLSELEGLFTTT